MRHLRTIPCLVALLPALACTGEPGPHNTVLEPGDDAQRRIQTALIEAEPGDVVELGAGRFELEGTLSLDVEGVTLRGQGMEETFLDFARQEAGTGGEGILVTSDRFVIEDLSVENTRSDAIKVEGSRGVTFRRVRVDWAGEPKTENGAYGLYPVLCRDVLIEDSRVRGASDAGIYVGQSENIVVRRNEAWENVAGIEIENSVGADVYENRAHHNTGGLLVFSLPDLELKNGHGSRIFNNEIHDNNHPNFGLEGNIVATIPPGTGLLVMANDKTEVFENTIRNNQTANLSILSFLATGRPFDDPEYDPYPEGIYVHHNAFEGGGDDPRGAIAAQVSPLLGGRLPDIVYDGMTDPEKEVEGRLPPELGIYISENGDADFVNMGLGEPRQGDEPPTLLTDLSPYAGQLPESPSPVVLGGAM